MCAIHSGAAGNIPLGVARRQPTICVPQSLCAQLVEINVRPCTRSPASLPANLAGCLRLGSVSHGAALALDAGSRSAI